MTFAENRKLLTVDERLQRVEDFLDRLLPLLEEKTAVELERMRRQLQKAEA